MTLAASSVEPQREHIDLHLPILDKLLKIKPMFWFNAFLILGNPV